MAQAEVLKRALTDATNYVSKIGAPEPHFRPTTYGRLHSLTVKTQICHQASHAATNYWDDKNFDAALACVIGENFSALAASALALMASNYAKARVAEKESLLAQLAEIEALEQGGAA